MRATVSTATVGVDVFFIIFDDLKKRIYERGKSAATAENNE
jgi:hypothetical protein